MLDTASEYQLTKIRVQEQIYHLYLGLIVSNTVLYNSLHNTHLSDFIPFLVSCSHQLNAAVVTYCLQVTSCNSYQKAAQLVMHAQHLAIDQILCQRQIVNGSRTAHNICKVCARYVYNTADAAGAPFIKWVRPLEQLSVITSVDHAISKLAMP